MASWTRPVEGDELFNVDFINLLIDTQKDHFDSAGATLHSTIDPVSAGDSIQSGTFIIPSVFDQLRLNQIGPLASANTFPTTYDSPFKDGDGNNWTVESLRTAASLPVINPGNVTTGGNGTYAKDYFRRRTYRYYHPLFSTTKDLNGNLLAVGMRAYVLSGSTIQPYTSTKDCSEWDGSSWSVVKNTRPDMVDNTLDRPDYLWQSYANSSTQSLLAADHFGLFILEDLWCYIDLMV